MTRPRMHGSFAVAELEGKFEPLLRNIGFVPASPDELRKAHTIMAFSFGYRLKPTDSQPHPEDLADKDNPPFRLPGTNNETLARIVADLKRIYTSLPLAVQFEIADALRSLGLTPEHSTLPEDWGTPRVIKDFLEYLKNNQGWNVSEEGKATDARTAIVVAHKHHLGRCLIRLQHCGVQGLVPPWGYGDYDMECEAQWRVRNPDAYICSDFVSMADWIRNNKPCY